MKQLIILILVIIAFIMGFGKYNEYKRFNTDAIAYNIPKNIDFNYHNKAMVLNYHKAIEDLNSFIILQWTANNIDVRTPEDDDPKTLDAVKTYSNKLANLKFYEKILENSFLLKKEGHTNKDIKNIEFSGQSNQEITAKNSQENYNNLILSLFNSSKRNQYGQASELIFETQKLLIQRGFQIEVDGLYKRETSNAIKTFEAQHHLFPDGKLDLLTLTKLLENN